MYLLPCEITQLCFSNMPRVTVLYFISLEVSGQALEVGMFLWPITCNGREHQVYSRWEGWWPYVLTGCSCSVFIPFWFYSFIVQFYSAFSTLAWHRRPVSFPGQSETPRYPPPRYKCPETHFIPTSTWLFILFSLSFPMFLSLFQPSPNEGANNLNVTNASLHPRQVIWAIIDLAYTQQSQWCKENVIEYEIVCREIESASLLQQTSTLVRATSTHTCMHTHTVFSGNGDNVFLRAPSRLTR